MTREEAIKILSSYDVNGVWADVDGKPYNAEKQAEAFDMAIEALSNCTTEKTNDIVDSKNDAVAEPTDLISRADAIKAIELRQTEQWIDADVDYNNGLESAVAEIKALPSADRPSGEWEDKEVFNETNDDHFVDEWQSARCSVCGKYHTTPYMYYFEEYKYCPNCGAKMGSDTK